MQPDLDTPLPPILNGCSLIQIWWLVLRSQPLTKSPKWVWKGPSTISRNSDRSPSVSHMYVTILQLLKLHINNLLFLTSTVYRYGMIFMVMAALKGKNS